MWTLNIKTHTGIYLCFRCGESGNWMDFIKKVQGESMASNNYLIRNSERFLDNKEKKSLMNLNEDKKDNLEKCLQLLRS